MNYNAIIATLVLKGIISFDEGQALAEFLHDKPQSTVLKDSIEQVKEIITMQAPLTGGPEQQGEELAAREQNAQKEREAAAKNAEEADEDKGAESDEDKDTDKK